MLSNGRVMWLGPVVALILSLMLAGCADFGASNADPGAALVERADARWQALIAGDFAKAYGYETPAYREAHTQRMFMSRFGGAVAWTAAKTMEVKLDESGEAATVRVMISYQTMDAWGGVMEGHRPVDERWVRTGGEWWHINN